MPTAVQRSDIPESIRTLDVLPSDYIDVFTATARDASSTSPEQWARTALERASARGRFLAWQVTLGLRLDHSASPERVVGWNIADRGDTWIRLEAASWFVTANMIFHVEGEQVSFATLLRYDRPLVGALIWTPVSAVHRRLAPDVLNAAVRRIERDLS